MERPPSGRSQEETWFIAIALFLGSLIPEGSIFPYWNDSPPVASRQDSASAVSQQDSARDDDAAFWEWARIRFLLVLIVAETLLVIVKVVSYWDHPRVN
jgi:hypothetical protein